MIVLIIAIVASVVVAAGLFVGMMRRDEPHLGMFGMFVLQVGGVLGTVYGTLASL